MKRETESRPRVLPSLKLEERYWWTDRQRVDMSAHNVTV